MAFDVAEETPERVLRMPPTNPRSAIGRLKWRGGFWKPESVGQGTVTPGREGREGTTGKPRLPTAKPTIAR
jgi:hypothetical protein